MPHNIRYGLYLGLISVAFSVAIVLIDYTLLQETAVSLIPVVLTIAILVIAGRDLKEGQGGYLSFKEAFLSSFIIYAIAGAIVIVYQILLYNVFAPEIAENLQKEIVNQQVAVWEMVGMSDEEIDQQVAQAQERNIFSPTWQLISYAGNLIFGLIIAAIIAAIVKKNKPEFD
ncbi:MAG: DUF4199 domain-containing protein [Tunicatimonas sp.]